MPSSAKLAATVRRSAAVCLGVTEAAIALQTLITTIQQIFGLEVGDLAEGITQSALEESRHLLVVAVGAAPRLAHDLVHKAQALTAVVG